jgi:zinc transporter
MSDFNLIRSTVASATDPELIWAYAFDGVGPGRAISETPDLDAASGFFWLHLDLIHVSTRGWLNDMEATFGAGADALMSQDSHPHVDWAGDLLWGAARDIHREVSAPGERADDLRFILSPRFLITGRRRPMQSAHALKRKIETGAEFESSADLLEALLTEIAEAIGRVANRTAEQLEEIEDRVFGTAVTDERAALLGLRREVARYARLATSLRAVVGRLDQTGAAYLPRHCQGLTARLSQRVASLHADIHYLSDHARLLNDEVGAQVSAQANKHLFTLTVLTTLLLPPSLVTGYFGMNTKNLLFADSDYGTLFATAVAAGAALLVYLLMRRNRMLGTRRA